MAKVFISYSHDSEHHKRRIRELAERLRAQRLEVLIDQDMLPGGPNEGWDHWSEAQVRNADRVLIACTERYCARYNGEEASGVGLGAIAEARLIHRIIYNAAGVNPRFRVILFDESDGRHIPDTLQSYHKFPLYHPSGLTDLMKWLTLQAASSPTDLPRPTILWPPPATQHIWDMADRRPVTDQLEQMLTDRSQKRVLLLRAESNSGKTHLLAELKAYAKRLKMPQAALDCKGELALEQMINLIALYLGGVLIETPAASGSMRQVSLLKDLQNIEQPVLLSFDTYEQAALPAKNWIETQLLSRLDECPAVVAVIAGQEIPIRAKQSWSALAEEMKLEAILQASDWLDYTRRKWHPDVNLDHIEALTLATKGNPGNLSALLENMMTGLKARAGGRS
jgi:hypothetical protein